MYAISCVGILERHEGYYLLGHRIKSDPVNTLSFQYIQIKTHVNFQDWIPINQVILFQITFHMMGLPHC